MKPRLILRDVNQTPDGAIYARVLFGSIKKFQGEIPGSIYVAGILIGVTQSLEVAA